MTTLDGDGDGITANAFSVGQKPGNTIVQNGAAVIVVPVTIWLFGSGLIGLFGFMRSTRFAQQKLKC